MEQHLTKPLSRSESFFVFWNRYKLLVGAASCWQWHSGSLVNMFSTMFSTALRTAGSTFWRMGCLTSTARGSCLTGNSLNGSTGVVSVISKGPSSGPSSHYTLESNTMKRSVITCINKNLIVWFIISCGKYKIKNSWILKKTKARCSICDMWFKSDNLFVMFDA